MKRIIKQFLIIMFIFALGMMVNIIFNFNTIFAYTSNNGEYEYQFLKESKTDIVLTKKYLKVDEEIITIPSEIDGYKVKSINADYSFFSTEKSKIKKVVISEGIENLGTDSISYIDDEECKDNVGVFYECTNLEEVILPSTLRTIRENTFAYCKKLKKINIPNSVETIGNYAFQYCSLLEGKIKIGKKVKSIGDMAFSYCDNITSISVNSANKYYSSKGGVLFNKDKTELITYPCAKGTEKYKIPSTVKKIDEYAFCSARNMMSVIIPKNIKTIKRHTFAKCRNLKSITFSNNLKTIGESAFSECKSLKKIILPNNLKTIGDGAFLRCKNLKSITIPNNVNSIESSAFNQCEKLTNIKLPNNLKTIKSSTFMYCKKLKDIKLPNNLKSIEPFAFSNCESLTKIIIPNTVETIEYDAFNKCINLKDIVLSKNLKLIDDYAFQNCKKLKSLEVPLGIQSMSINVISGCKGLRKIIFKNPYCKITSTRAKWKNKNMVVYGYNNSKSKTFAKKEGLKFKSLGKNTTVVNLDLEKINKLSIKLTWKKVSGATKYEIYQSTDGRKWKKTTTAKKTYKTINKIKKSKTYYYKVRAVKNNKKYSFSTYIIYNS